MQSNSSNINISKYNIPPLLKYKIVFLGDQCVGSHQQLTDLYTICSMELNIDPPLALTLSSKNIFLQDKTIRIQLWDTAGQERFLALIPNYIRDASVQLLISFNSVQKWINDIRNQRGHDTIVAIIGNKIDLTDFRAVTLYQGQLLARANSSIFWQVSAKQSTQIEEFFKQLVLYLPDMTLGLSTKRFQKQQNVSKVGQTLKVQQNCQIKLTQLKEDKRYGKNKCC